MGGLAPTCSTLLTLWKKLAEVSWDCYGDTDGVGPLPKPKRAYAGDGAVGDIVLELTATNGALVSQSEVTNKDGFKTSNDLSGEEWLSEAGVNLSGLRTLWNTSHT